MAALASTGIPGDVNADGEVDAKDITLLRRHIVGGYHEPADEAVSDLNRDGFINAKDVSMLRRYLAGGYGVTLA